MKRRNFTIPEQELRKIENEKNPFEKKLHVHEYKNLITFFLKKKICRVSIKLQILFCPHRPPPVLNKSGDLAPLFAACLSTQLAMLFQVPTHTYLIDLFTHIEYRGVCL
jgi:hypothetical protein